MREFFVSILRALLLFWAFPLFSQPTRPIDVSDQSAPAFRVYTSDDGLTDEIWSTIGFDRDGFVWAGSASALARFDGYRWQVWPGMETQSLVRDMASDDAGILWAAFEREGLARYDDGQWQLIGIAKYLHRFSELTAEDGSTQLWAAIESGLSFYDGKAWQADAGNQDLDAGVTCCIEQTQTLYGAPRQWLGTLGQGLWFREAVANGWGAWQRFPEPELNAVQVTDLLRTSSQGVETLWVVTYSAGLIRLRDGEKKVWRASDGELPSESLYTIVATQDDHGDPIEWVASRAGLLRIHGDKITTFDRRHGLPADAVRSIKVQKDASGSDVLWLATEGGIARTRLTGSSWRTVSRLGAKENGISALLLEPNHQGGERLWVGSYMEGVAVLEDGNWNYLNRANGRFPAPGVRGIWRVRGLDGRDWRLIGTSDGRLFEVADNFSLTPIATPWVPRWGDPVTQVFAREVNSVPELWVGTMRSGFYRWRKQGWQEFNVLGVSTPLAVNEILQQVDAAGKHWLWAATDSGLARFDGSNWKIIGEAIGLPLDRLRNVALMGDGDQQILWLSSHRHSILRVDVTEPQAPTLVTIPDLPTPPDSTAYSTLRDSQGRIYLCTNNGVQQLLPMGGGGYRSQVFRRSEGLVHDECNTNAQWLDSHDRYWVGTLAGLSVYDPSAQAMATNASQPLRFTGVRVDGNTVAADALKLLPPGTRELRIDYALLAGWREDESAYRSRLVGYDIEVGQWTPEHHRSFTSLPPGRYTLRVEARDYSGTHSVPQSISFEVAALWWQRSWIKVSAILLLLGLIALSVMLYNRNLRRRQRELKNEVAIRTQELEQANRSLTDLSYQDALTGVANRRRLTDAMVAAMARAVEQNLPIGIIVADIDHFKEFNDQHGHLLGDIALRAVAQAIKSATRDMDLVARFGGEEFACLMLDADIQVVTRVAERMRTQVQALPPQTLGTAHQTVTISVGVVSRVPRAGERAEVLLQDADRALYQAKADGRNRVQQYRGE